MKIIILGSSYAIPDENHGNTHLLVLGNRRRVLIDAPEGVFLRLKKARVDIETVTDLIMTHFHPDHIAGVPQLILNYWLLGRKNLLNIHGLNHSLSRVQRMLELYNWHDWPGLFPVEFHKIASGEREQIFSDAEFQIFSSPGKHFIPTIGLRIEAVNGKIVAYTGDGEPCPEILRLAQGADILLHETTDTKQGHSSPEQAGQVARNAGVRTLYLIHYPLQAVRKGDFIKRAMKEFTGEIMLADDFLSIDLN